MYVVIPLAVALFTCLLANGVPPPFPPTVVAHHDAYGRLQALAFGGSLMPVQTDLRWFQDDWQDPIGLAGARDESWRRSRSPRGSKTTGEIQNAAGQRAHFFMQTLDRPDGFDLDVSIRALTDLAGEGLYYWIEFPIATFQNGTVKLFRETDDTPKAVFDLPPDPPEDTHVLGSQTCDRLRIESNDTTTFIDIAFLEPRRLQVQDLRAWGTPAYGLLITLRYGECQAGDRASLSMTLEAGSVPEQRPATAAIAADATPYPFAGMGGNYCFDTDSPQTDYTLEHLDVRWARTEMTLQQWEPENDNDDPDAPDWERFRDADADTSKLRREFELARRLQDRGIPYAISVWHLPNWCYADPTRSQHDYRRHIAPGMWPEVAESIVTYLQHAKRAHGVEPDLFSFNEPDIGVRVLMTPEQHHRAVLDLGRRFAAAGLKTQLLLGDVSNARDTHTYLDTFVTHRPATEAAGALGVHTWGGASPAQFAAWRDTADRFKLPLLVTEFGSDPHAWRTGAYTDWFYAIQELKLLGQLMHHARPQSILTWEYTADYALLTETPPRSGNLVPTPRFHFTWHFSNLLPADARYLKITSDHPAVQVVGLVAATDPADGWVVHIANLGAARPFTLIGVPTELTSLACTQTTHTEPRVNRDPVAANHGQVTLTLPAQSLTTLHHLP